MNSLSLVASQEFDLSPVWQLVAGVNRLSETALEWTDNNKNGLKVSVSVIIYIRGVKKSSIIMAIRMQNS